jgi:hypothetical protein
MLIVSFSVVSLSTIFKIQRRQFHQNLSAPQAKKAEVNVRYDAKNCAKSFFETINTTHT